MKELQRIQKPKKKKRLSLLSINNTRVDVANVVIMVTRVVIVQKTGREIQAIQVLTEPVTIAERKDISRLIVKSNAKQMQ